MSTFKENLYHPQNYNPISTYTGYNWPSMCFGVFWGMIKGLWGFMVVTFIIAWFTWGLGWLVTAAFANAAYTSHLKKSGYLEFSQLPEAEQAKAERKEIQ